MLSFVAAIVIILAAGFWAFQGMFSAVVMFGEVLISLMIAFGFYEPFAAYWKETFSPELAEPGFLILIFFVSLIVMRSLTDRYIPGNIRVHYLVDRAVGGLFGMLSGLVVVGITLVGLHMLPVGRTSMGFDRFPIKSDGTVSQSRNTVWFNPDGFTVGLVNFLTNQRFNWDGNRFAVAKPDFLDDLHYRRAGTQLESAVRISDDAIDVREVYRVNEIKRLVVEPTESGVASMKTTEVAERDNPSSTYMVCKVAIKRGLEEPDIENGNPLKRPFVLFTPAQFRLVGPKPTSPLDPPPRVFPAVGMSNVYMPPGFRDEKTPKPDAEQMETLVKMSPNLPLILGHENQKDMLPTSGSYIVDVVFEVPGDDFRPWYVEFKSGARAEVKIDEKKGIRSVLVGQAAEPPKPAAPSRTSRGNRRPSAEEDDDDADTTDADSNTSGDSPSRDSGRDNRPRRNSRGNRDSGNSQSANTNGSADAEKPKVKVGQASGGRTHIVDVIEKGTAVTDEIPVALPKAQLSGLITDGKLGEGHKWVELPDDELAEGDAVTHFAVPEGKKLVLVSAKRIYAGSMYGQALEFAKNTLNQYFLVTGDGTEYFAQGMYIRAKYDGKNIAEVQYWPEAEVKERALKAQIKLTAQALRARQDFDMVFIFIVDPGVKVIRFHRSRKDGQDLQIDVPA